MNSRFERLAPYAVGVLFALPVLLTKFPPMADLPLHEVVAAYLRHWGDSTFVPEGVFRLNIGHPNQLQYYLIALLSLAVPIEWASKLVVAGAVFAVPVAAGRFASYVGASRMTALLVAPVALGWLFFWGLLANLMGLALLLAFLPNIDRFCEKPSAKRFAEMVGVILCLHMAHQLVMLMFCMVLGVLALVRRFDWKLHLVRLLPIGLVVLATMIARRAVWSVATERHAAAPTDFFPLLHKIETLPGVLFAGFEPWVRNLLFVMAVVPIVLFAIEGYRSRELPEKPKSVEGVRSWAYAFRFELVGLAFLLAYFVLPATVKTATLVYHRFLHPGWAILIVSVASRAKLDNPWRLPRLLAPLVPLASVAVVWPIFADAHRVYTDLDKMIAHMERGSSVLAIPLGPRVETRLWQPPVAEAHIVAKNGGRTLYDICESPVAPVNYYPDKFWFEIYSRLLPDPYYLSPGHDLRRFRYLLFITQDPDRAHDLIDMIKDDARFVDSAGEWYLLESKLPRAPISIGDTPLTRPRPPSLRKMLKDRLKKWEAEKDESSSNATSSTRAMEGKDAGGD